MFLLLLKFSTAENKTITFPRLEKRKRSDVCGKYKELYPLKHSSRTWSKTSEDQCDLGFYNESADHEDASRRLTYYRYLAGLERPFKMDTNYTKQLRECATVLNAIGSLNHYLDSSMSCYTEDAATGCRTSNLAWGTYVTTGAIDIDLYIDDSGVSSLGHRRWCLNPTAGSFGLGRHSYYGALKVIGTEELETEPNTQFVAYPSQGPIHYDHVYPDWTFFCYKNCSTGKKPQELTITRVSDGANVTYTNLVGMSDSGYYVGLNGFKFTPNASMIEMDNGYYIQITTELGCKFEYTVKPTNCEWDNISDLEFERMTVWAPLTTEVIVSSVFAGIAGVVLIVGIIIAILKYQGFSVYVTAQKSDRSVANETVLR